MLFLFPGCNQKDSCLDDGPEAPKQIESNNDDTSSELPETNQGNDNEPNEVPKKNVSSVSITDGEKTEIQRILSSADKINIDGDVFVNAIYHTSRCEKLSFMSSQESVSRNLKYEPIIIDERDIFDGISESQYMYLFFNYTDDGKDFNEVYDHAYKFQVGSYTQGFSDAVCLVFNREITVETSRIAPSERMAIIKMPFIEDIEYFELRVNKSYENELACIKDIIQESNASQRYMAPDVSSVTGNLKIESCFFDIKDSYILPEEIFAYDRSKYSEKALIYSEKELFPESEEENLYLLFSFELSSDRAYTLIGDTANLNGDVIELKFKLVESGGNDAFTKYVVLLKLNGLNDIEQTINLRLEFERIPYNDYKNLNN